MSELLSKFNYEIRNKKRIITEKCIVRKRGKLAHICLNSQGCRFRKSGSCTMCNYGEGHMLTKGDMEEVLSKIAEASVGMDSILIGSLGSVLDESEVSYECLEMICAKLESLSVPTIILETHYTMITERICKWICSHLKGKDIVVEMGLESADVFVQQNCLNKVIHLGEFKDKINLLHSYGVSVTANVFLGAPFLTVGRQIADTVQTIYWAIGNMVDSVVIFPANVRKDTVLYYLYQRGEYQRISHWQIFEVLKKIPAAYLNRIYLAWYGDWIDLDAQGDIENLCPYSCPICEKDWMAFYRRFLNEPDGRKRKELLRNYERKESKCDCRQDFEELLRETEKNLESCSESQFGIIANK